MRPVTRPTLIENSARARIPPTPLDLRYDTDGDAHISPAEFYDVYMDAKKTLLRKRMTMAATAVAVVAIVLFRLKK